MSELNTPMYDDAALEAAYKAKRQAQIEEDREKPFDPEAILEIRHLRKCFPLKKTITGKVTRQLFAVDNVSFELKADPNQVEAISCNTICFLRISPNLCTLS